MAKMSLFDFMKKLHIITVSLFSLLAASAICIGCGKADAKPSVAIESETETEAKAEETTISTQEDDESFLDQIKIGASVGEVAEKLNTSGREVADFSVDGSEIKIYQWYNPYESEFIQATFQDGSVIGKNGVSIENECTELSKEVYDTLTENESYADAVNKIGAEGKILAQTDDFTVYGWMEPDGATIHAIGTKDCIRSFTQYDLK